MHMLVAFLALLAFLDGFGEECQECRVCQGYIKKLRYE